MRIASVGGPAGGSAAAPAAAAMSPAPAPAARPGVEISVSGWARGSGELPGAPAAGGPPAGQPVSGLPGPADPGTRRPRASRRAAANARQAGYRSAGAFAIALASTVSTAAGRSARRAQSDGGASDSCAQTTARPWSRLNGGAPQSISKEAQASA